LHPHIPYKLKNFLTLAFLLFVTPAFSQDLFRIENGIKYADSLVRPFMRSLNSRNDFVLAFRTYFPGEGASEAKYFILTGRDEQLKAYSYLGAKDILADLNLSPNSLDQIWKTFQQNSLFTIRDEKDIPNFCAKKYDIYESYTYEFTILSQGRMKVLSYYSPEYYIEACYGISERQNIINSVAIINLLVRGY
jgi:hypothetical protein